MAQRIFNANTSGRGGPRLLATAAAVLLLAAVAWPQNPASSAVPRPHRTHKPSAAQAAAAVPQPAPDTTPQPEIPKWPANEAPGEPTVTWNSQGLRIQATNSSLSQILNTISTQTGAKIEGVTKDERVFGEYGPGPARDVLSQLLHGSNYDFLLLGDQGQGTPRQVFLTARRGRAEPANADRGAVGQQETAEPQPDDDTVDQPEQPEEPPQPIQAPPQQAPQQDPMTPQQRMQMMQQQRLQQMQQLQQQQQQQQQEQQQQPQ